MTNPTISVCMIVRNEEINLPRCLESVKCFAQQVVVVDTGSDDGTPAVAKAYGAEVYHVPWQNSFSEARNSALDKARCDWILILDGDDTMEQEGIPALLNLINDETVEGYFLQTASALGQIKVETEVLHPTFRLFRNRQSYRYTGRIHESVIPSILEIHGPHAIRTANVIIRHTGYLRKNVLEKDKASRNLGLLRMEMAEQGESAFLLYNVGVEYLRLGQYDEALLSFNKAETEVDSGLSFAPSLVRKKADCLAASQISEAIAYLRQKIPVFPDYTDLVYQLGLLLLEEHRLAEAIEALLQCLALGEAPPRYLRQVGTGGYLPCMVLGSIYELTRETEKALAAYRRALAFNGQRLQPLSRIISLVIQSGGAKAVREYLTSFFDLATPKAQLAVAEILLRHHCPQEALVYIEEADADGKSGQRSHYLKGHALLVLGKHEEAELYLAKIGEGSSIFAAAAQDLCLLYWWRRRYELAESVIAKLPPPASLLYRQIHKRLLGMGLGNNQGEEAAKEAAEVFLSLLETSLLCGYKELTEKLLSLAEGNDTLEAGAGKLLFRLNNVPAARRWLDSSIRRGFADSEAVLLLVQILLREKQYRAAFSLLQPLLRGKDLVVYLAAADLLELWGRDLLNDLPRLAELDTLLAGNREPSLSLCMIARDEAERLADCLQSVMGLVDEIILVDTGSSDNTPEIARKYGAVVYSWQWNGDFSAARNFALEKAHGDWILLLDADEVLHPEDVKKIRTLLDLEAVEGYCVQIINYYGSLAGSNYMTDLACRIFRNRPQYRFRRAIHEQVVEQIIAYRGSRSIKIANVRVKHYGYLSSVINKKNKAERNLGIIREGIKERPDDNFLRYSLGVELLNQGDYSAALRELEKSYLPGHGYSSDVALKMAVCLKELDRQTELLGKIDAFLLYYPDFTDLVFIKGESLLERGEFTEAAKCFRACLQLGDAPVNYCGANGVGGFRAIYFLGKAYEGMEQLDDAQLCYRQAVAENPHFHLPLYALAVLMRRSATVESTEAQLLKVFPELGSTALLLLADIFMHTKDYQAAYRVLDRAEKAMGSGGASDNLRYLLGRCLACLGETAAAEAVLREVSSGSGFYVKAMCWRMLLAWLANDIVLADAVITLLYEAEPELAGAYEKACKILAGGVGIPVSQCRRAFVEMSRMLVQMGRETEAEALLKHAKVT